MINKLNYKTIKEESIQDETYHERQSNNNLKLVTSREPSNIYEIVNNTYVEYSNQLTLSSLFEKQVRNNPDKVAVTFNKTSLTYKTLNKRANQLAHTLRTKGVGPDSIVGVLLERSLETIISMIAILKAGGAYLILDPQYPNDRINYIIDDSKIALLVTTGLLYTNINFSGEIVDIYDSYLNDILDLPSINNSRHLAYVIYTSGSTGKPKGVAIEHRSVVNLLTWFVKTYDLSCEKNVIQLANMTFDVSVEEIFGALISGASLYLPTINTILDKNRLLKYLRKHDIAIAQFVPATLREYFKESKKIESLQTVICGGDKLDDKLKNEILDKGYNLYNHYGPTETTVDALTVKCAKTQNTIGRPINNTRVYIVDDKMNLLPIGEVGELCLSGDCLARGYLNQKNLSSTSFIDNPFEANAKLYKTGDLVRLLAGGSIEFIGRKDSQVKIRGFRIELGEIEAHLLRHDLITETVVIDRDDGHGNKYLCAYIISKAKLTIADIREYLFNRIPEYMIPSYCVQISSFKLSKNGKVDRKALPDPRNYLNESMKFDAPTNEIEKRYTAIWRKILNLDQVGITDNFFDMGGDSLQALRFISETKGEISITDLFENPTIKKLAQITKNSNFNYISVMSNSIKEETSLICIPYAGANPLIYQKLKASIQKKYDKFSVYGVNIPGNDFTRNDIERVKSIEEIAHGCLIETMQKIKTPVILYGHCAGMGITIELARLLEENNIDLRAICIGGIFPPEYNSSYKEVIGWSMDDYSNSDIHNILSSMGGFWFELREEELKQMMVNLREDDDMMQEYFKRNSIIKTGKKLNSPIYCIIGDVDPMTECYEERFQKWEDYSKRVDIKVIQGGNHFFIYHNADELTEIFAQIKKETM